MLIGGIVNKNKANSKRISLIELIKIRKNFVVIIRNYLIIKM